MDIQEFSLRFDKVKWLGKDRFKACCPIHSENNPSFFVSDKGDKLIMHCFGCGINGNALISAGIATYEDMFLETHNHVKSTRQDNNKFPAGQVFYALKPELNIICLFLEELEEGVILSDKDKERFKLACKRVRKAYDNII